MLIPISDEMAEFIHSRVPELAEKLADDSVTDDDIMDFVCRFQEVIENDEFIYNEEEDNEPESYY